MKWEDEVLRQKHLEVVQQRDELKEKHRELIAEVKQKASFKHLLLEKKFDAVAEQLEARDAQLDDALVGRMSTFLGCPKRRRSGRARRTLLGGRMRNWPRSMMKRLGLSPCIKI